MLIYELHPSVKIMAYCHSDLGVWYVNVSYMWNELQRWRDFCFLCLRFNLWWLRSVFLIGCQDWLIGKLLFSSPVRCSRLYSICAHHSGIKHLYHTHIIFQITWQDSILTRFMLKVTQKSYEVPSHGTDIRIFFFLMSKRNKYCHQTRTSSACRAANGNIWLQWLRFN